MSRALVLSGVDLDSTHKDILEFHHGLPTTGLVDVWAARGRVIKAPTGEVSDWVGAAGNKASQTAPAGFPAYSATGGGTGKPAVVFTNPDILHTALQPSSAGYLVALVRTAASMASHQFIVGSQTNTTNRCGIALDNTFNPYGQVGAADYTGSQILRWGTALSPSTNYVVGMYWNGSGGASLRTDGTERDTATYNGSGATVGTDTFSIGGRHQVDVPTGNLKWQSGILAVALYNTTLTGAELNAIDAAMALLA